VPNGAYTLVASLAAALLFLIEPMAAKALLPALGGTAAVWSVSLVFFQTVLLGGYYYAHRLARLPPRRAAIVHGALVLAAAALVLGRGVTPRAPLGGPPALAILGALAASIGLPFLALAATGPLVARWRGGSDPYRLYAASNASSLLALLAYPLLLERHLPLAGPGFTQSRSWAGAFLVFAGLVTLCAARATTPPVLDRKGSPWPWRWVLLALVPSATMLGATQAITTDVASVPLLWVVPLALYLLTFVIAFALPVPLRFVFAITVALVLATIAVHWRILQPSPRLAVPLSLVTLFVVGLLCHGRLAAERPAPGRLTTFYLATAAGGALGSILCALLAPLIFDGIAEYPLALVLACLCGPGGPGWRRHLPRVAAAATGLLWLGAGSAGPLGGHDVFTTRSFFGVLRVRDVPGQAFVIDDQAPPRQFPMHELYHGTTLHGLQIRSGDSFQLLPTAYYHPTGPLGRAIAGLRARPGTGRLDEVGVVGLGVGALAAYAQKSERFTFFEIDPAVVRIARDPALFTYLRDTVAVVDIHEEDGRVGVAAAPDDHFYLLVMDAFSSDAVPVHLLTREALALALRKLRPGGLVAYHLSSAFFDLAPILAEAAAALGKEGLVWFDDSPQAAALAVGKARSLWAVVARDPADLEPVTPTGPWQPLATRRRPGQLWTDLQSSPLAALRR
jgi:SAM-dependent methyltransferase